MLLRKVCWVWRRSQAVIHDDRLPNVIAEVADLPTPQTACNCNRAPGALFHRMEARHPQPEEDLPADHP
jgi:hypothetical protein